MNDLILSTESPPAPLERSRLGEPEEPAPGQLRVLVLTGLKEELEGLLKSGFQWDPDTRLYRSMHLPHLFAGTTGPGLKKRKELRRCIERALPDVIINGGLVGSLLESDDDETSAAKAREPYRTGDRLRLGQVIDAKSGMIYPGGRGHERLVTVDRPVFEPIEKMNLRLDHGGGACDMEAARLLHLVGEMEDKLPEAYVIFCKVVGDLPEDYFLFQLEDQIRSWGQRSRLEKIGVFLRYPENALRLMRLFRLKQRALGSLTGKIGGLVRRLYREGRITDDMDSVFIPH